MTNQNLSRLWFGCGIVLVLAIFGHLLWFLKSGDPTIGQRLGTAFIVIGIIVTAQPFLREGFKAQVERQLPEVSLPMAYMIDDPRPYIAKRNEVRDAARPSVIRDILAERVIGVGLIVLGTLINGYGDIPLKCLGIPKLLANLHLARLIARPKIKCACFISTAYSSHHFASPSCTRYPSTSFPLA